MRGFYFIIWLTIISIFFIQPIELFIKIFKVKHRIIIQFDISEINVDDKLFSFP
jgi:hypothetical protein